MKKAAVVLIILVSISAAILMVSGILPASGFDVIFGVAGGETVKEPGAVAGKVSVQDRKPGLRDNSPNSDGNGKSAGGTGESGDTGRTGSGPGSDAVYLFNEGGTTISERIMPPEGFERVELEEGSFGEFLRELPLKPHGTRVRFYDGQIKSWDVHAAVVDIDVGDRDLQQCADAVIRLRAEYLYSKGLYDQIHFNFTNGFNAEYKKWMEGYRIRVSGNEAMWVKREDRDAGYASFRKYLDVVFAYAGTLSLSREMEKKDIRDLRPGDVFLKGGSPGHCVIVVDMAVNPGTGEKVFLIAQSYMPAQDIHILRNPSKSDGDPWYPLDFGDTLITPEWTFTADQVYSFPGSDNR